MQDLIRRAKWKTGRLVLRALGTDLGVGYERHVYDETPEGLALYRRPRLRGIM